MFIYNSLSDHQKEAIDREIREGLEKMLLSNGGFNYSDKQFTNTVYRLIISNEVICGLLGDNSPPYFSLKETVVMSRAYRIACELESNRPTLNAVIEYFELCKLLLAEPSTEVLFSSSFAEEKILSFREHIKNKKTENQLEKIVDNFDLKGYTISSNIKSFECLIQSFYDLKKDLSA